MPAYGSGDHSAYPPAAANTLSVPFLVLAAVLIGVGLFGTAYWLVSFNLVYAVSLIPLILGAFMLFLRGTGPDGA